MTVNVADANAQVGQFPLIKYGTKTGAGTFVLGTLPPGVSAVIVNNVGNSSIDLNITSTSNIRWGGQVSAAWDIATTFNWTNVTGGATTRYTNGAAVNLDDTAAGVTAITLGVAVSPGALFAANDTLPYSVSGAGSISGAASVTKSGTNALTINTVNSYTGATVLNGSTNGNTTLIVNSLANGGSPSAIGSASSSAANLILNGGNLSYTGPATSTDRGFTLNAASALDVQGNIDFSGVVASSPGAGFTKTGNGKLTYKRAGATTHAQGGFPSYNAQNGTVVMDGTAGSQVNTVSGEMWVGGTTNSTGALLVLTNGTTLNHSSWLAIARGTGTGGYTSSVALYDTSKVTSQNMSLGYDNNIPGSLQVVNLSLSGSSTFTNNGVTYWSESAGSTATITLKDSSVFHSTLEMQSGWHAGATSIVTVANSAKVIVNRWMSTGNEGGDSTFTVRDTGSLVVAPQGDLNICDVSAGTSVMTVQDSGLLVANALFVGKGNGSTGVYNQNGGTSQGRNGGGLYVEVGSQPFSTATLNLNGGTFKARRIRSVNAGLSTVNFNGAQVVVDRDGGDGVDADFLNNITTANILAGGANIDTGTNNIAIAQVLGGIGGLNKTGTGTLLLNGVNTYTGNTVATGTLGGSGTIAGNVNAQSLSPGSAAGIGQLTISGNLTFSGNLSVDVATSVSPSNDVIAVTGSQAHTGPGNVVVNNLGPVLQVGQKFYLFNGVLAGGAALTVTGGGATWQNNLAADGSIQVLTVLPAPTFTPGSVATLLDGNKSITATGIIGQNYRLWASTDVTLTPIISTWTLLSSGTVTASPFTINDLNATNFPNRFYIFSTP